MPKPSTAVKLMVAILETVAHEGDKGAPEGPMYLAFAEAGITLDKFNALLTMLEAEKFIHRKNHTVFVTVRAKDLLAEARA